MKRDDVTLSQYFEELETKKGDLHDRCEQYARWTVPSVFPEEKHGNQHYTQSESKKGNVAIGARLVNHLAHRIVDTMYPNDKPFFAVNLTAAGERRIMEEAAEGEDDPIEVIQAIREGMSAVENEAMQGLNLTAYRPIAVNAVVFQIVTGNAIIRRMPDDNDSRVVYSVRDYVVHRDISGGVLEVILRDTKQFGELDPMLQMQVMANGKAKSAQYRAETEVVLYTYFRKDGKRWMQQQAVEDIDIEDTLYYKAADFPLVVLTWNLGRGDHYGRGLVEDYSVSFHNIDVLTEALIDMIGMSADIKFLVDPGSGIDIEAFNNARRGEYVSGRKDDVSTPDFQFAAEIQTIAQSIEKLERELAQAFLLQSAGVRDAERVTAEEIRFYAREIESAFGGLYSRLALDWQKKEAEYQLSQVDFSLYIENYNEKAFDIMVTTGLESLSREGKLDNLRLAIADLGMLEAVPEDVRAAIHPLKFAAFIFRNRTVSAEEFLYTPAEFKANQERAAQQEAQMQKQQQDAQVAQAAMK